MWDFVDGIARLVVAAAVSSLLLAFTAPDRTYPCLMTFFITGVSALALYGVPALLHPYVLSWRARRLGNRIAGAEARASRTLASQPGKLYAVRRLLEEASQHTDSRSCPFGREVQILSDWISHGFNLVCQAEELLRSA